MPKTNKINNKDNLEMDRKYDLINQTKSKSREGHEVPKQPTELEHIGEHTEALKIFKYVKPKTVSEVSVDIADILQLNTHKTRKRL